MKWYHDQNIQKVPFKEGDQVMLDLRDYQKSGRKFTARYYGPFKIAEKLSLVTFRLEWPARAPKLHPVFHASKLDPYTEPEFEGQKLTLPPPDIIDGHEEYEVEEVINSRRFGRWKKLQYYVRWKGYERDKDGWEPVENVTNADDAIRKFYEKHPEAVRSAMIYCISNSVED